MTPEQAKPWVPLFLRMLDLVVGKNMVFGDAMAAAAVELGHTLPLPPEVETMLLVRTFQIVSKGRIPGAGDA